MCDDLIEYRKAIALHFCSITVLIFVQCWEGIYVSVLSCIYATSYHIIASNVKVSSSYLCVFIQYCLPNIMTSAVRDYFY